MTIIPPIFSIFLDIFVMLFMYLCGIIGLCFLINGIDERNRDLRSAGVILISTFISVGYASTVVAGW